MNKKIKKCPKCNQILNKIYHHHIIDEKKTHIGYFCNNCGTSFKIEEIDKIKN